MFVSVRTPLRVSLFGGGTDYPAYFHRSPGAVLGFTIDKYIYISALPLTATVDYRYRLSYSKIENVDSVDDIEHLRLAAHRHGRLPLPPQLLKDRERRQRRRYRAPGGAHRVEALRLGRADRFLDPGRSAGGAWPRQLVGVHGQHGQSRVAPDGDAAHPHGACA